MRSIQPAPFHGFVPRRMPPPRGPVAAPPLDPAPDEELHSLYALNPRALWAFLRSQRPSFWFISLYLFFEYVRPQSIYSFLDGPPWTQITILLALGAYLIEGNSIRFGSPADFVLAFFTAVLLASSLQAYSPDASYDKLADFFAWVLIYLLISNIVSTERRFLLFMLAFLLYSFKMSQHATRSWAEDGFVFRNWGVTGAPGWFHNSGEFGVQMAIFLPLVTYFIAALSRHWGKKTRLLFIAMVVTAIVGTIASSSRGAMLGVTVVMLLMLIRARYKVRGLIVVLAAAAMIVAMLPPEFQARFESAGEDETSLSRKQYWKFGMMVLSQYPLLGIGYANWPVYYKFHNGYGALPHNIFIEASAELGYAGLTAFVGLILCTFFINWRTRAQVRPLGDRGAFLSAMAKGLDAALVGFLVSGFFVTVLYYPFFWINLALTVSLHNAARNAIQESAGLPPSRPVNGRAGTGVSFRPAVLRPPHVGYR
jgi:putative inorganic carbon (HCO3(-)) transporter